MKRRNLQKFVVFLFCLFFVCTSVFAKKDVTTTRYDIEGYEVGTQGTYLVKVFIYTKKPDVTVEEFKYAAVHGVIFKGISGKNFTNQKPLAQADTQLQNQDYFHEFFNNGDYLNYAKIINPAADRIKVGKEYKIVAIVSVSKDNLRKALEKAGVIRGLNTLFQ